MDRQKLIWIPLFGVWFIEECPLIIFFNTWWIYQLICTSLFGLSIGMLIQLL